MSGDFYLLGVSASSGLPSSLLVSLRWQFPLFCASQPSFQLLLGCTIFHYTPKKEAEAGISACWCTLEEGAGPSACRGERPSFREPCPRLECPQGGAGQAIAGYVKHGVDGRGMVAASPVRPLAFSRAPKTVQGRRTPLTLLHSGVKPAWIPLPGLCTHSLTTTSPKIWSTASGCWNKEYHRLLKEDKTYWTLLKILICAEKHYH